MRYGTYTIACLLILGWLFRFQLAFLYPIGRFLKFSKVELITKHGIAPTDVNIHLAYAKNGVVFDGKQMSDVPEEYGEHNWYVKYKGKWASFRHFKFNHWYDHLYRFTLYREKSKIYCKLEIIGPNGDLYHSIINRKTKKPAH